MLLIEMVGEKHQERIQEIFDQEMELLCQDPNYKNLKYDSVTKGMMYLRAIRIYEKEKGIEIELSYRGDKNKNA